MKKYLLIAVLMCTGLSSCYKEELVFEEDINKYLELPLILSINNKDCAFDEGTQTLRYPLPADTMPDFTALVKFQKFARIYFNDIELKNEALNNLGTVITGTPYIVKMEAEGEQLVFTLTFTHLPIVQLVTTDDILNEPKTLARFNLNYPQVDRPVLSSYIGVEERGASAQFNPKKSMGFSFLKSQYIDERTSRSIFDLPANSDWILDAMYIDPSRMRNKSCFEIWQKMNPSYNHYIQGHYVEVYLNREHLGIYYLADHMNAELLELNSNSVLYKAEGWGNGTTTFDTYEYSSATLETWDGWVQRHPDPRDEINWSPLKDLRQMAVHACDVEFADSIFTLIDEQNAIDFYILINLISGADNTGKNIYLLKTNPQKPFEFIPWDMDLTFGFAWPGVNIGASGIITNNLFNRLLATDAAGFKNKLKTRWFFLRNEVLTETAVKNVFYNNYCTLIRSGAIHIETEKWCDDIKLSEEQQYIENWIPQRLAYLDNYFSAL